MSQEENFATLGKLADAVSTGKFELLDDVFAQNIVDHDPAADQGPGPDGYKHFFAGMRAAFPDLKVTVDHLVSTDTDIGMAYTISGTHKGIFAGIAPTNVSISARGMQIARFEGGKIVERWGSSDELGILLKLGAKIGSA